MVLEGRPSPLVGFSSGLRITVIPIFGILVIIAKTFNGFSFLKFGIEVDLYYWLPIVYSPHIKDSVYFQYFEALEAFS